MHPILNAHKAKHGLQGDKLMNVGVDHVEYDGWAVSYKAQTDTGPETALIVPKGREREHTFGSHNYFILRGDHRDAYAKFDCLADAKHYFNTRPSTQYSPWSD